MEIASVGHAEQRGRLTASIEKASSWAILDPSLPKEGRWCPKWKLLSSLTDAEMHAVLTA